MGKERKLTRAFVCVFIWFLFFAFAIGSSIVKVQALSPADCRNGVVRIYAENHDGIFTGTGFFVGKTGKSVEYIITNAHVIEDKYGQISDEIYVIYEDIDELIYPSNSNQVTVIKDFPDVDLAILRLKSATDQRVPLPLISAKEIEVTSTIYAVGYPGISDDSDMLNSRPEDVTITKGTITKERYQVDDGSYLQIDAAINSGNSGGPLVTENGAVCGINSWKFLDAQSANYALYIDYAIQYLDAHGIEYETYLDQPNESDNFVNGVPKAEKQLSLTLWIIIAFLVAFALAWLRHQYKNERFPFPTREQEREITSGPIVNPYGDFPREPKTIPKEKTEKTSVPHLKTNISISEGPRYEEQPADFSTPHFKTTISVVCPKESDMNEMEKDTTHFHTPESF